MAKLKNEITNMEYILRPEHILGRDPKQAHTQLDNAVISRIHAVILWNGEHWKIRDMSTNGSFVNGSRLPKNTPTPLYLNDKISFGSNSTEPYTLKDSTPPIPQLIPLTPNTPYIELTQMIGLPSENEPEIVLFSTPNGVWHCETKEHTVALNTGDIIGVQSKRWEFVAATANTQTIAFDATAQQSEPLFTLKASRNEEHINAFVHINEQTIDLGERTHHYLLLILARKKLADQSLPLTEQGWYDKDQLSADIGVTERHINIHIFRLRKQLADIEEQFNMSLDAIERRKGEIRFAYSRVVIEGGINTEVPFQKSAHPTALPYES